MIENMRKYTGLMVVVLVLLAAGLVLTMQPAGGGGGGGASSNFMNVNGVTLDRNDFSKAGEKTTAAIQRLIYSQNFKDYQTLGQFSQFLSGSANSQSQAQINFVTNRILLKQQAEKLGLYASTEVAAKFIENQMFRNNDGGFDAKSYHSYIESLGSLGLKESDFQQLVAEYIVFDKALAVIGGGLTPSEKETIALMKAEQQTISLSTVSLQLADFKKEIVPTEEEIKTYWETTKDAYLTERQLKVTYALTNLDASDEPKRPTPAADADPAVISQLNLKYEEELAAWTQNRKAQTKILTQVFTNFSNDFEDSNYENFNAVASKAQATAGEDFSYATTEPFSQSNPPAALASLIEKHSKKSIVDLLFGMRVQNDRRFDTKPYTIGRDGHILVSIDEEIMPTTKTFEQAKELATAALIQQRAETALKAAAEKAQTELSELVKSGKTFELAAQEKGFAAVELKNLTRPAPESGANQADFYRIAQVTTPKTVATELSKSAETTSIVYVESRVFELGSNNAAQEAGELDSAAKGLQYTAFNAWLTGLKDKADPLILPRAN